MSSFTLMAQVREIIHSSLRSGPEQNFSAVQYLAMLAPGQGMSDSCTCNVLLPSHWRQAEVVAWWFFFTVPLAEQQELCPTLAVTEKDVMGTVYWWDWMDRRTEAAEKLAKSSEETEKVRKFIPRKAQAEFTQFTYL